MRLLDRVKTATNVLFKGSEINFQWGASDSSGLQPKISRTDYTSQVESFEYWTYVAVSCIARNVAKNTVRLYNSQNDKDITDHPFWDLWQTINPQQNAFDLLELTSIFLDLTGNAYWYVVKNGLRKPVELYVLRSNKVKIIPGAGVNVAGYEYWVGANKQSFEPDEIVHFRYPNPYDDFYGLAPLAAMAYTPSQDNAMHQLAYYFLKNSAMPGNIFIAEEWVDRDMLKASKEEIKQEYEGVKKTGKTMVLKGLKPSRLSMTPQEMGTNETSLRIRDEIMAFFGVPLTKVGIGGTVQGGTPRATAEALDATFQQETVSPRLVRLASKMNDKLLPMWDRKLKAEFTNPVPADREFELRQWDTWLKDYVVSVNEYRTFLGQPPAPWGNKPIAPFNLMPLGGTAAPAPGKSARRILRRSLKASRPEFQEAKNRKWAAWVKYEEAIEKRYIADLKSFFQAQHKVVAANVDRLISGKVAGRKNMVDHIFPAIEKEAARLTEVTAPHIREMAVAGISIAAESVQVGKARKDLDADLSSIGMTPTTFDGYVATSVAAWQDTYAITINDTLREALRGLLDTAAQDGWNVTQLQTEITSLYASYGEGMEPVRALMIARTETARVMNDAELTAYKSAGITEKTWGTALDADVCEECDGLDGETVGINDAFSNGEAGPPAHPSCRCTVMAGNWSTP